LYIEVVPGGTQSGSYRCYLSVDNGSNFRTASGDYGFCQFKQVINGTLAEEYSYEEAWMGGGFICSGDFFINSLQHDNNPSSLFRNSFVWATSDTADSGVRSCMADYRGSSPNEVHNCIKITDTGDDNDYKYCLMTPATS
jgi:hypothetical protein